MLRYASAVLIALLIAPFFASTLYAQGASNQFTVGILIDDTAPGSPGNVVATGISGSQISITWDAAIDNVGISGYRVFRELTFIGTSTSLSFTDSGLAALSTYAYTVSAFDGNLNEGPRSATTTGTTLSGTGGGGAPPTLPYINNIVVTPDVLSAGITWETTLAASSTIYWGESTNYGLGSSTIPSYITNHSASLTGLQSDTVYYYKIDVESESGNPNTVGPRSFTTLNIDDFDPPTISNVAYVPGYSTTTIQFDTDIPARSNILYGTTTGYEIGTISTPTYNTNHSITLTGLQDSTVYYYRIEALDVYDQMTSLDSQTFTTLTPPDTTPPANVSGLTASTTQAPSIDLSWTNPADPDFDVVRVMRLDTSYPVDPFDGDLIYEGPLEAFVDNTVLADVPYYYTVFARDTNSNYSSGALTNATVVTPPPPPPPPPPDPGDGGDGIPDAGPGDDDPATTTPEDDSPWWVDIFTPEDDPAPEATSTPEVPEIISTSTTSIDPVPEIPVDPTDPFQNFPEATEPLSPVVRGLSILDFAFIQDNKKQKMSQDGTVKIDVSKNLKVSLPYEKAPEVLKTLAIVMTDPLDPRKKFPFLLRINSEKTDYEATIAPLGRDGTYEVSIVLLNYKDQRLKRMEGYVVGFGEVEQEETRLSNVAPVVGITGIGIGVGQAVALAGSAKSFGDLWLLFVRLGTLFSSPFRRRAKTRWGVVYDSETKLPLDPAYVTVHALDGRQVGEALTDMDGRYGFILEPGTYRLEANKTHYEFPSKKLAGRTRDELFNNLYFGAPFEYDGQSAVDFNIPLDPVGFDWNEYEKQKHNMFKTHRRRDKIRATFFNLLFYSGLGFSLYTLWQVQSVLNYSIVGIYVGILVFQFFWRRSHKITKIIDSRTGEPMPFTIVKAFIEGNNVLAKKVVADKFGQFLLLVSPGKYYLTLEARQPDGSYIEVHRTDIMELKKGVIAKDIEV